MTVAGVSLGNQTLLNRVFGQLGCRVQAEFSPDILTMKTHRLDGDIENEGDLLGALAFGDQLERLALPPGKPQGGGGAHGIREALQVPARKTRAHVNAAIEDALDRRKKLFSGG